MSIKIKVGLEMDEILEGIYGAKRLAEIRANGLAEMRRLFKSAKLVDGIWVDKDGKKFAKLGMYPELEPSKL